MMENLLNVLIEARRISRNKTKSEEGTKCRKTIDWSYLGLAVWQTAA